ncbi:MAG: KpsF/GutQ family sugar-phosphate isomerase [Kiritimatiellales bacterium]|nr:KpsF/GutQ family sugar-phosphate isomerase [Kiritimatiellales bacterium]
MDYLKRAQEVIDIETAAIEKVKNSIGTGFTAAVDAILQTVADGGKVVVAGVGKNLHIGNKIAATLTSTGTPAVVMHPIEAMHGDFGILGDKDILLAMSYSGASDELLALLQPVKRKGVKIIAMTGDSNSPLAQHSDIVVSIEVEKEACPFNMAPTASTTATLVLGDALAMVLLEARGFGKEDYAKLHPGGAIGRTLLLRVDDVMRTGERCAKVGVGQTVKEALMAMTGARAGCVAVVEDGDQLAGIVTDGDLRRHLIETPNLVELPVESIMTANPVTLTKDMLAAEVLNIFEKHNIDDLIVVDKDNRVIGAVDIQDLPKLKIL